MTKNKNIITSYDTSDIWESQVNHLIEEEDKTRSEAEQMASEDSHIYEWEWDQVQYDINEAMGNRAFWKAEGTNMGWRNLSGSKVFQADNSKELLEAVLPETELTLTVWKHYKGFKLKVSHHDSPTGEYYIIKPISEQEYIKSN